MSASPWLVTRWTPAARLSLAAGVNQTWQVADLSALPIVRQAPLPGLERARAADLSADLQVTATVSLRAAVVARVEDGTLRQDVSQPRLVDGRVHTPLSTGLWFNALDVDARGYELTLRRTAAAGPIGWLAYAYGRTRAADRASGERYWADFDQRHQLNAFVSWPLGRRTNAGATFRYGSNMPLPAYARLDVRASRTLERGAIRFTLFAEVVNVLGRANVGRTTGTLAGFGRGFGYTEPLFPRLPSAGLRVAF